MTLCSTCGRTFQPMRSAIGPPTCPDCLRAEAADREQHGDFATDAEAATEPDFLALDE